jgi:cytochrome c peroxidase
MMRKHQLLIIAVGLLAATACKERVKKRSNDTPISNFAQSVWGHAQDYFSPISNVPENPENPITKEKVELGQMLYFDTRLSKTGNNSCNSCHNLATFGVDNLPTSPGDAGKKGDRNSPTTLNAAFHIRQFWDGRAKDVEEQAGMPILNPIEMAIPSKEFLVDRLKQTSVYPELFKKAFPNESNPLTYQNIQKAIGAFERTLITPSKFDQYLASNPSHLNTEETEGLALFIQTGCTNCHAGVALGGNQFQKFGVYHDFLPLTNGNPNDKGKMNVTNDPADKYVFKVPSLRNVAMTAPYFHDGSVQSLEKAIQIMAKTQLDKDLSSEDTRKIAAFLNTLTGELPEHVKVAPKGISMR